jgi:MoaA/NifB/PqqE/SkfB family radical SAM enzyme
MNEIIATSNDELPDHLTKGGPGDKFLGGGRVNTSEWFVNKTLQRNLKQIQVDNASWYPEGSDKLEQQIKDEEIWFCGAPFQMLYTSVGGRFAPCSWACGEEFNVSIQDTDINDFFINNEGMNKLRTEMLTPGSDLTFAKESCQDCLRQEKIYGRSRRQASLKIQSNNEEFWPNMHNAVNRFKVSGKGHIEDRIFEVQIKAFGNECNFDCYMCFPFDSTVRIKSMDSDIMDGQNVWDDFSLMGADKNKVERVRDKPIEDIIEQIVKVAPYIRHLKLIGGEPLVMAKYYQLMEAVIATGHGPEISIKYQTNMSVLTSGKYDIRDYLSHFQRFEFTVSLDGIGSANDYIRRRSNWENIVNNIKEVKKYPKVTVCVNGTITFLSVMRFYQLIEWFDDNIELFDQINWSNIRRPEKLCANVLPHQLKKELISKYEGFPDIQNVLKESNNGVGHQDAIDYLLMQDKQYKDTKWESKLFDVFPELEQYHNQSEG